MQYKRFLTYFCLICIALIIPILYMAENSPMSNPWMAVSDYAHIIILSFLGFSIIAAFDHFVLTKINTLDVVVKHPVAIAIMMLGFCLIVAASIASAQSPCPKHVQWAQTQVGLIEEPGNTGPHVATYLAAVGLPEGYPYCAAFVSKGLDVGDVSYPHTRSALATDFIVEYSIHTKYIRRGIITPESGWLLVFRKGDTRFGHIAIIERIRQKVLITIEANTSSDDSGSQRDGEGVYRKQRGFGIMLPSNYFRATHVTPVLYRKTGR